MNINILGMASIFLWVPAVVVIFAMFPPRRAVVISFVAGWLVLPQIRFDLPGLPNYSKMTATVLGVLLSTALFDINRLISFRPRWYDLPVFGFCVWPFISCVANDYGAYGGLSTMLNELFNWGFPYLIGRIYLADSDGLKELATGIVVGGLAYAPGCLLEIRLSPLMAEWVYGIHHFEPMRYGGYRPKMFLSSGLELGMWMTCASLLAQRLWSCGTIKLLGGYPFGVLTAGLLVTTILCKSTGAILLLIGGIGILSAIRVTKSAWPALLIIVIAPGYTATRTTKIWSGREILAYFSVFGQDRIQSLDFRMENEDLLTAKAIRKPVFGWGRYGQALIYRADGRLLSAVDGYWIIVMMSDGVPNLIFLESMLLLPLILLIKRQPVQTWTSPELAPAAGLSMVIALFLVDSISNAMLNPIYAVAMGGLMGLAPLRRNGAGAEVEVTLAHAAELVHAGYAAEAEPAYRHALQLASEAEPDLASRLARAEALEGMAASLTATGRLDEASEALREALEEREAIAAESGQLSCERDAALVGEQLARVLAGMGHLAEAVAERRRALAIWDRLAAMPRADPEWVGRRVDAMNDLAWLTSAEADLGAADPAFAVALALEATRISPERGDCWNTLGLAYYRSGDWAGALDALERSAAANPSGGTAFDDFVTAMALARLGELARARESFVRAVAWSERNMPGHPTLERFREEAVAALGTPALG